MSKFYYYQDYKSPHLSHFELLYLKVFGLWQVGLIEGILLLLYCFSCFGIYFLFPNLLAQYPYLFFYIFGVVIIFFILLNLISYFYLKRRDLKSNIKGFIITDIILLILVSIFPNFLTALLFSLFSLIIGIIGMTLAVSKKRKTITRFIGFVFILTALIVLFSPNKDPQIIQLAFIALFMIAGFYLIYWSLKVRKKLTAYIDEIEGFTKYQIR